MENSQTILEGSSDVEKGAYLGAIASIATADREATDEEVGYLTQLAEAASLSDEQTEAVINAAKGMSDEETKRCLDVLKTSELRFSLVTDLIAFAKSDNDYSANEQKTVEEMSTYLGLTQQQFSLLDSFTDKSKEAAISAAQSNPQALAEPQQQQPTDFLSSLGLKDKFESAGIKGSSLLKGIIGFAAPMILANMVSRGMSRNSGLGGGMFGNGGGMFGNSGGGMFGGGGGGMFGGGGGMLGGGLGSIFSMLAGGRGFSSGGGGLLGRILGGRF
jgi:uncharacterized tellurite resistance protein B-like protein